MEVLKILDKPDTIDWEYDEEADVLYLSVGTPKPAVGNEAIKRAFCSEPWNKRASRRSPSL